MAILVSNLRYMAAADASLTEDTGVNLFSWNFFKRAGDTNIKVQIEVTSGSVGFRFDGSGTNEDTAATGTTETDLSVAALANGKHSLQIVALEDSTTVVLMEAHFSAVEQT